MTETHFNEEWQNDLFRILLASLILTLSGSVKKKIRYIDHELPVFTTATTQITTTIIIIITITMNSTNTALI